jgi:regulator of RNase E activity RraA
MLAADVNGTIAREALPMADDSLKNALADLARISVATITMQLLKRGVRNVSMAGVRPLNRPVKPVVGVAYTLRYVPLREDLSGPAVLGRPDYPPRRAIEEAPAGSVLVIDGRGRADIAVVGDILVERLKVRGVAGMVSDGGVRDCAEALKSDLPLYAAGPAAPASIGGHAAADIETPVACGGVAVFPGDVIAADGDGVVVVPRALAGEVARDGLEQERYERFAKLKIKEGRKVPGVYPPNEQTKAEYQDWLKKGEPGG